MPARARWNRGDYFALEVVEYRPEGGRVWLRFRNGDIGETTAVTLWGDRPGEPDWKEVGVDPDTHSALLVPTLPGRPTLEGEVAEIPGDVIRAATDVDYRAYVARHAANWARRVGRELAQLREAKKLTRAQVAEVSGLYEGMIAAVESGRMEVSLATVTRLVKAMGADLPEWLESVAR